MKIFLSFLLLCSLVFLSACSERSEQNLDPEYSEAAVDEKISTNGSAEYLPVVQDDLNEPINVSMITCSAHEECPLPMGYAIRSSCPYAAVCIEGKCAIACQEPYPSAEAEVNREAQCTENSECTCEFYSSIHRDLQKCVCIQGLCSAVVTG